MKLTTLDQRTNVLGYGLVQPFARIGSDFETHGGRELIRSSLQQIIGTQAGQLRWRPSFGANLDRLRHQNMNEELKTVALKLIEDSISAYESRVIIEEINVEPEDTTLKVTIRWAVVSLPGVPNQVLIGPVETEVIV